MSEPAMPAERMAPAPATPKQTTEPGLEPLAPAQEAETPEAETQESQG